VLLELGLEVAATGAGIRRKKPKGHADGVSSASGRIAALWLQNQFSRGASLTYFGAAAYERALPAR